MSVTKQLRENVKKADLAYRREGAWISSVTVSEDLYQEIALGLQEIAPGAEPETLEGYPLFTDGTLKGNRYRLSVSKPVEVGPPPEVEETA